MTSNRKRGRPPHPDILTPAEWRTVRAAQHGLKNHEIAERTKVSVNAVKYHLKNALAKLSLSHKQALRHRIVRPKHSALSNKLDSAVNSKDSVSMTDNKLSAIGQLSRVVKNISQSEAWYREVLGLTHLYSFEQMAFFDCGGTRLYLSESKTDISDESIIYFQVDDIEQSYQQMKQRGVTFTNAPHMIFKHPDGTEEWLAFFEDLEKRPLALMSQEIAKPTDSMK